MSPEIAALRHRARTGMAIAAADFIGPQADTLFAFWQAYAKALRDLERGAGAKLAEKDATLGGYEAPGQLAAAIDALGDDIERLTRGEVRDRLAQCRVEIPGDGVSHGHIGAAQELEDGVGAAVHGHTEVAAAQVDVGDPSSHPRSVAAGALLVLGPDDRMLPNGQVIRVAEPRQRGSALIQALGGALALALVLGTFGPTLDNRSYADYARDTEPLLIDGEVVRLDVDARQRCRRLGGDNAGWIHLHDGTVVCTDKRGRRASGGQP